MSGSSGSGNGYWASQMLVCGIGGVGLVILGPILLVTDEESPGYGLIFFLTGLAFLGAFVWLVRSYRRSGRVGRAVYAWAIMQQHGQQTVIPVGGSIVRPNDAAVMATAARARDGKLSLKELKALQAMRPEVPYPGVWPQPPQFRNPNA